jgi:hypothetical protein
MRVGMASAEVCIRDISSRGLLLQAAVPPPRGTYIEIFAKSHTVVGRVVWREGRRFGVHTQERMDVAAIAEERAAPSASATGRSGERRSDPHSLTTADMAQRLDRSRRMSSVFEFGCVVACGAAAAVIVVSLVEETLSRPLESVARAFNR